MRKLVSLLCLVPALSFGVTKNDQEFDKFATKMAHEHSLNKQEVLDLLLNTQPNADVIRLFTKPATSKPMDEFERLLINEQRIVNGIAFWQQNKDTLQRAEEVYGIPANVIVALIGVETAYGKNIGSFNIAEALITLGFHGPRRQQYFQYELEQFLIKVRDLNWNISEVVGSYAGAIGIPQFMPSNIDKFAVDFDSDGHIDLVSNHNDAIGSVANYLSRAGWKKNIPIAVRESKKKGKTIVLRTLPGPAPVKFLCTENFNVIKRYNPSDSYAMIIFILSEKLKERGIEVK